MTPAKSNICRRNVTKKFLITPLGVKHAACYVLNHKGVVEIVWFFCLLQTPHNTEHVFNSAEVPGP